MTAPRRAQGGLRVPRWAWWLAGAVAALVMAHLMDRPAHDALAVSKPTLTRWEQHAWYLSIKAVGSWPTWAGVALVLLALDWLLARCARSAGRASRSLWRRALPVALAPAAGGLAAELAKLLLGRERPTRLADGEFIYQGYVWRPLGQGFFDATNLGLPSSHAATAAGGAVALGLVVPRLRAVAWSLAAACALSRVVASAHFLSDVTVGALLGGAIAYALQRLLRGDRSAVVQ